MAASTFFSHNLLAIASAFDIASAAILGAVPVFFSYRHLFSPAAQPRPASPWPAPWPILPGW